MHALLRTYVRCLRRKERRQLRERSEEETGCVDLKTMQLERASQEQAHIHPYALNRLDPDLHLLILSTSSSKRYTAATAYCYRQLVQNISSFSTYS